MSQVYYISYLLYVSIEIRGQMLNNYSLRAEKLQKATVHNFNSLIFNAFGNFISKVVNMLHVREHTMYTSSSNVMKRNQ